MKKPVEHPLAKRELLAYRAEFRNNLFRQIHRRLRQLKADGFTQARMAKRLGMDPGQLSRILRAETDIRLETLADLARAVGCRVRTNLIPVEQVDVQTSVVSNVVEWSHERQAIDALEASPTVTVSSNASLHADSL